MATSGYIGAARDSTKRLARYDWLLVFYSYIKSSYRPYNSADGNSQEEHQEQQRHNTYTVVWLCLLYTSDAADE